MKKLIAKIVIVLTVILVPKLVWGMEKLSNQQELISQGKIYQYILADKITKLREALEQLKDNPRKKNILTAEVKIIEAGRVKSHGTLLHVCAEHAKYEAAVWLLLHGAWDSLEKKWGNKIPYDIALEKVGTTSLSQCTVASTPDKSKIVSLLKPIYKKEAIEKIIADVNAEVKDSDPYTTKISPDQFKKMLYSMEWTRDHLEISSSVFGYLPGTKMNEQFVWHKIPNTGPREFYIMYVLNLHGDTKRAEASNNESLEYLTKAGSCLLGIYEPKLQEFLKKAGINAMTFNHLGNWHSHHFYNLLAPSSSSSAINKYQYSEYSAKQTPGGMDWGTITRNMGFYNLPYFLAIIGIFENASLTGRVLLRPWVFLRDGNSHRYMLKQALWKFEYHSSDNLFAEIHKFFDFDLRYGRDPLKIAEWLVLMNKLYPNRLHEILGKANNDLETDQAFDPENVENIQNLGQVIAVLKSINAVNVSDDKLAQLMQALENLKSKLRGLTQALS